MRRRGLDDGKLSGDLLCGSASKRALGHSFSKLCVAVLWSDVVLGSKLIRCVLFPWGNINLL
jgi:hypothetical protein